jgi:hypothetical protein
MDALFLIIAFWIYGPFLFRRDWLVEEDSYKLVRGISVIAFLAGLALLFLDRARFSGTGVLCAPLLTLLMFRLCRKIFLRMFKREPKDTFMNWKAGLAADRLFNIAYFTLTTFVLIFSVVIENELDNIGW